MRVFAFIGLSMVMACAASGPNTASVVAAPVRAQGSVGMTMTPSSGESVRIVAYPLERVWLSLPIVFDSLAIPVNSLDPKTHSMGNAGFKIRRKLGGAPLSRYLECGTTQIGPNADSYDVQLTVMTQLASEESGATKITTTITAAARPMAFAQEYSNCSSKGALESHFAEVLGGLLQR